MEIPCNRFKCLGSRAISDTVMKFARHMDPSKLNTILPRARSYEPPPTIRPEDTCKLCKPDGEENVPDKWLLSEEDFKRLEQIIKENKESLLKMIAGIDVRLNNTSDAIGDAIKQSNEIIIKEQMRARLEMNNWFKKQEETLKKMYLDHVFVRVTQRKMMEKLDMVQTEMNSLKDALNLNNIISM